MRTIIEKKFGRSLSAVSHPAAIVEIKGEIMKPEIEKEKVCTGPCGLTKPIDAFYASHRARDGRQHRCKTCADAHRQHVVVPVVYERAQRARPSLEELKSARAGGIPLAIWGIVQ